MKFEIQDYNTKEALTQVSKANNYQYSENCEELIVQLPQKMGGCKVHLMTLDAGIEVLFLDGMITSNLIIDISCKKNQPLVFKYCLEGRIAHTMHKEQISYELRIPCTRNKSVMN